MTPEQIETREAIRAYFHKIAFLQFASREEAKANRKAMRELAEQLQWLNAKE